jgi:4-amino-4-deoxy-L-arabinose transferase-like glycosyltransferase
MSPLPVESPGVCRMTARRHLALVAAGLLVAVHFALLALHCPPAFSSPDANGYYAQAALLAEKGTVALEPSSALSYIGMHWLETPDGEFFSRYPPGVAVLMYVPYVFAGPELAALVTPLLASLTLLFLFLLARPYLGGGFALLAAGLYGLHPLANEHALNWGAHTQAGFFLVAGLYVLTAWARRPHWAKALAAGLLLGAVPTMRYAEVVAGLGVGVFLLMRAWPEPRLWRHVGVALLGALVPVGGLLVFNASAFGSPLDTGYALTGEQQAGTGFALSFFEQKWGRLRLRAHDEWARALLRARPGRPWRDAAAARDAGVGRAAHAGDRAGDGGVYRVLLGRRRADGFALFAADAAFVPDPGAVALPGGHCERCDRRERRDRRDSRPGLGRSVGSCGGWRGQPCAAR